MKADYKHSFRVRFHLNLDLLGSRSNQGASGKLKVIEPPAESDLFCPLPGRAVVLLVSVLLVVATVAAAPPQTSTAPESFAYRPNDPLNLVAFDHFYNLDYERAVREFDQVLGRHPDDPFAVNHLLTAVLFRELYLIGALNTGEYANDTFIATPHRPADPRLSSKSKTW